MQKSRNQIFKTLNISLIFLALGVLVAIFLGSFLISCANPKPTPTPPTPIQTTTKITGYKGQPSDLIFDSENNLFFYNEDDSNMTTNVFKVDHNTTNAIKIISTNKSTSDPNPDFKIKLDLKNNLYIYAQKKHKYYKVDHNTTNPVELKINGIDNANISQMWFDKDNNMFIDYFKDDVYKFFKVNNDTTNAIEITGINSILQSFKFDSENNLWITNGVINNIKFYEIKHDTTNAIEIKINGVTDYTNFLWIIDNKDNLYFIKYNNSKSVYDTLYRVNKNTTNPIEITGYSKDGLKSIRYKNKDNVYFNDEKNNFYQINSNSTTAIKITGYKGQPSDLIFDSENNLWINNNNLSIYEIKHDTTNAIEITGIKKWVNNLKIDKNNNVYFLSDEKIYEIEYNTTFSKQIEIPEYKNSLKSFYFDKSNNLFFIGNDNQLYKTINFIK